MAARHRMPPRRGFPSLVALAVVSALVLHDRPAAAEPAPPDVAGSSSPVRTILLAGQVSTWLSQPQPPYNVVITVKMKLERVGYRVVTDPQQAHDAVLVIDYQETQGRQYRALEHGTNIRCEMTLHVPTAGSWSAVWNRRVETGTSWPTPVGSVYWDAVQNLEEEPYYYYLGELLKGRLDRREEAALVFMAMLQESRGRQGSDGGGVQAPARETAQEGARLNAIGELGRLRERRALPLLWTLAQAAPSLESDAALLAIGEIGGQDSLDRLGTFANSQQDPDVKAVVQKAMARARERQSAP